MKPRNWEEMPIRLKQEAVGQLMNSMRGQFIMGQAIVRALEVMRIEERPETSNIQDMEMIEEVMFPLFGAIRAAEVAFARHQSAAVAETEALEMTH